MPKKERGISKGVLESAARNARQKERDDAMWAKVLEWREKLRNCESYPVQAACEETWHVLDEHYEGLLKRADEERVAANPLAAFFYYVEMGFYPPPEIMFALLDCYEEYLWAQGDKELEEVFFGPTLKKGGNYAKRRSSQFKALSWYHKIEKPQKEGRTKISAAEIVSKELGGRYDAETILRTINKDETVFRWQTIQSKRTDKKTPK